MKKKYGCLLLCLLLLLLPIGCRFAERETEPIPIAYSVRILVNREEPDPALTWAGHFQTPTRGVSILDSAFPESRFFGMVSRGQIQNAEECTEEDYAERLPEILGMSRREIGKKFNMALDNRHYTVWEDAVLFHFLVPEENVTNGEVTEYAGRQVFVEYRRETGEVYLQTLSFAEYVDANNPHAIHSTERGRVGDRYYLENGYYDLSEHQYRLYESNQACAPYSVMVSLDNKRELRELLLQEEGLRDAFPEGAYVDSSYRIKDRIYLTVCQNERYFTSENDGKGYGGSALWLAMLDAETNEILYVAAFHSTNYNIGSGVGLYQIGADGRLYAPYGRD